MKEKFKLPRILKLKGDIAFYEHQITTMFNKLTRAKKELARIEGRVD